MDIEKALAILIYGIKNEVSILILNRSKDLHLIQNRLFDEDNFVKGRIDELPFQSNSFGLIVLKGIISNLKKSINDQDKIFKKIYRILKPDGIFLLGIENKISPSFIFGENPFSTNNNGSSNNSNNIVLKIKRLLLIIKYCKANLLLYGSYIKLLRRIGFQEFSVYGAPQNLNSHYIISLQKNVYSFCYQYVDSPRFGLKNNLRNLFNVLGINKLFCHSYILIAKKCEV